MFICNEFVHLFLSLHSFSIKIVYCLRLKAILLNGLNMLLKEMTFTRIFFGLLESLRESSRIWDSYNHLYCVTNSTITLIFISFLVIHAT